MPKRKHTCTLDRNKSVAKKQRNEQDAGVSDKGKAPSRFPRRMTAAQAAQMLLDSDLEDVFDNDHVSDDFEGEHSDTDNVQSTAADVPARPHQLLLSPVTLGQLTLI